MKGYVPGERKEYQWESDDPYYEKKKYPEPTVCEKCGAVFKDGRWQWEDPPKSANKALCPACRRERDRYPGGILILEGEFLKKHKEEIMNRLKNAEEEEKTFRPLNRILWIEEDGDTVKIALSNSHIARKLGDALEQSFKGELEIKYKENEEFVEIRWKRD